MVARTADLPNVRKLFKPDPGYILIEGDLKGAESQVVAWECNSQEMKDLFRSGVDIHKENAEFIWGPQPADKLIAYYRRDRLKRCVYAIQNGGKEGKITELLEGNSIWGAKFFNYWNGRFPEIKQWHQRIELKVKIEHMLTNVWGYRNPWFDRVDGLVLNDAIPWITQSTIGITCDHCVVALDDLEIQVLIQIHDAVLMQVRESELSDALPAIHRAMSIPVPYADPLTIPVTLGWSEKNWGELNDWRPS